MTTFAPSPSATRRRVGSTVLAPLGFLAAYLAVSPVSGALADRDLPLPDDPTADVVLYYAANPGAVVAAAGLQVVSVACFALFVAALAPTLRRLGAGRVVQIGYLSTAAMVVSSILAVVLAVVVGSAAHSTVALLRDASFYAGGVVNVVTLGVVVFMAARVLGGAGQLGTASRRFGLVAGSLAMLSILSLVFYYANAFLPIGRMLSMVWTVVAGIVLVRIAKREPADEPSAE